MPFCWADSNLCPHLLNLNFQLHQTPFITPTLPPTTFDQPRLPTKWPQKPSFVEL